MLPEQERRGAQRRTAHHGRREQDDVSDKALIEAHEAARIREAAMRDKVDDQRDERIKELRSDLDARLTKLEQERHFRRGRDTAIGALLGVVLTVVAYYLKQQI